MGGMRRAMQPAVAAEIGAMSAAVRARCGGLLKAVANRDLELLGAQDGGYSGPAAHCRPHRTVTQGSVIWYTRQPLEGGNHETNRCAPTGNDLQPAAKPC